MDTIQVSSPRADDGPAASRRHPHLQHSQPAQRAAANDRAGRVRMYVCGVTPYDSAHIGHGMSLVTFDIIRRYLEYRGYDVRHVQNFTDIDDKIIARANREGIDPERSDRGPHRPVACGVRALGSAARPPLPAGHPGSRADHRHGRRADRAWPRLPGRRRCLLPGPLVPGLRQALPSRPRRSALRRPHRGRRAERGSARFRPLESRQAGRAELGIARGDRVVPAGISSARR